MQNSENRKRKNSALKDKQPDHYKLTMHTIKGSMLQVSVLLAKENGVPTEINQPASVNDKLNFVRFYWN